jgi:hypothetical protein
MFFSWPIQWYPSHADLIWPDGIFNAYRDEFWKNVAENIQVIYFVLFYIRTEGAWTLTNAGGLGD